MREDPHYRRLRAEFDRIRELEKRSQFVRCEPVDTPPGAPPERYVVTFTCKGVSGITSDGQPVFSDYHQVLVHLDGSFPSAPPKMKWLTDIWHPNIEHFEPKRVCIDPTWWAPARSLDSLLLMLGEMVQYKNYWAKDEPPGYLDREAADWVRDAERLGILGPDKPVDSRELLEPEDRVRVATEESAEAGRPDRVRLATEAPAASARVRVLADPAESVSGEDDDAGTARVTPIGRVRVVE